MKIYKSIAKKVAALGLAAIGLAVPAHAQYVSTAISGGSGLAEPSSAAVDGSGNLYIADSDNNRIAVYNPLTEQLSTLAGSTPGTNNGYAGAQFFNPTDRKSVV